MAVTGAMVGRARGPRGALRFACKSGGRGLRAGEGARPTKAYGRLTSNAWLGGEAPLRYGRPSEQSGSPTTMFCQLSPMIET